MRSQRQKEKRSNIHGPSSRPGAGKDESGCLSQERKLERLRLFRQSLFGFGLSETSPMEAPGQISGLGQISNSGAWAGTGALSQGPAESRPFWTYHRTLLQVCVAPSGEPATMGTWMGLCCLLVTRSSFSSRDLQVASRACSLASMLSNRKHIVWLIEYRKDCK